MQWQKISIIGVGLLGGSIGLMARKAGLAKSVHGYVRRPEAVAEVLKAGAVDEVSSDLQKVVSDADLVILCTPIAQMLDLAKRVLPFVKKGAIVTDVGSVKGEVTTVIEPLFEKTGACFIGSHPMAGSERMGVAAAKVDLFKNAVCVVTPTKSSSRSAATKVQEFWEHLGARVISLSPAMHDELVSRSSHLPHVVAAELANYVLSPAHSKEQAELCATGFRDTTRVASGSPEMWRDIAMANKNNLVRVLGVFIEGLQEFQYALEKGDEKQITEFFTQAKERRDRWSGHGVSPSPE